MSVSPSRRALLQRVGALAGAGQAQGQGQRPNPAARRRKQPPVGELVNTFEFEDAAKAVLDPDLFALVAGGDRAPFERMTFRPRMFVSSTGLDLTTPLFGEPMFAPIVVGPVADQRRFHPAGEPEMVRGAGAAKTVAVISTRSSEPLEKIVAAASAPVWFQVFSEDDPAASRDRAQKAIAAGCKAVWITLGSAAAYAPRGRASSSRPAWRTLEAIARDLTVPVALKGVIAREDVLEAQKRGFKGLVISAGVAAPADTAVLDVLPRVVDAVGPGLRVLFDGSVRRGTDVLKALALGAAAAVVSRPAAWGLAAYGADGVRTVLELLQSELARAMITVGRPTVDRIDRTLVAIHRRVGA
jgi:isopentenyl diphosphate isomerase/L-lactate dehydrogenase-like FMN-dependent dehydrogenase